MEKQEQIAACPQQLFAANEKWAIKIAIKRFGAYFNRTMTKNEIATAALIGLWRASENFHPGDADFRTFASKRVFGAVIDAIRSVVGRADKKFKREQVHIGEKMVSYSDNRNVAEIDMDFAIDFEVLLKGKKFSLDEKQIIAIAFCGSRITHNSLRRAGIGFSAAKLANLRQSIALKMGWRYPPSPKESKDGKKREINIKRKCNFCHYPEKDDHSSVFFDDTI